jgi:hypothetical protein
MECTLLINDTTESSFLLGISPHEKRMMPLVANPERVLEFMIILQYKKNSNETFLLSKTEALLRF